MLSETFVDSCDHRHLNMLQHLNETRYITKRHKMQHKISRFNYWLIYINNSLNIPEDNRRPLLEGFRYITPTIFALGSNCIYHHLLLH